MSDFYNPRPVIQLDGSRYAGSNCTAASAAIGLDRATSGAKRTTGARVRALTGDSGGLTLAQVDNALNRGWGSNIDVRWMAPFWDIVDEIASGHGALLQGGYGVFHAYHLAGSFTFFGNHSIWWNEVRLVRSGGHVDLDDSTALIFDPLWDGRMSSIPSKRMRWVPLRMMYQFAAMLALGGGRLVGPGRCYAGLMPRTRPLTGPVTLPAPSVPTNYGSNHMIATHGGLVLNSTHRMSLKKGQPLYREARAGSPVVTRMSAAGRVKYMGHAAAGWRAVIVKTANFSDGVARAVIVYVPATAGTIAHA